MNAKQILLWYLLALIFAQLVFYEQLNTAFDAWRMKGCERIKDIDAYDLEVNPKNGDLWGISSDSLFRFDGTEWHIYKVDSLQAGYVTDTFIVFDPQGKMWQGGWNGVGVFDGKNWRFYSQQDWGLPDTIVTSIAFDPTGKPWIGLSANGNSPQGTCGGISLLDGERWLTYPFKDPFFVGAGCQNIQSIQFDSSGNAWLGLSSGVLMILKKTQDETFQAAVTGGPVFSSSAKSTGYFLVPEESLPSDDHPGPVVMKGFSAKADWKQLTLNRRMLDPIHSVLFDSGENIWINAGDSLYRFKNDQVSLARSSVRRSIMDAQGNIWSVGQVVSMYDGKAWTSYRAGNSCIGNEDVRAITFDKNNRAWVSRFPSFEEGFSLSTFEKPPHRIPDVVLRLRAIFLPLSNSWLRWVGPILLGSAWLLIFLGAKWPAFTFPLLNITLALATERIHQGQYYSSFIFELLTLFSLSGGLIHTLVKGKERKVGFWKNAAPGFYGTLICILLLLIAGILWNIFGPSS